jgi:hypothetical protein
MGPQEPKDVTNDAGRDLSALVGEVAALGETLPTDSLNRSMACSG